MHLCCKCVCVTTSSSVINKYLVKKYQTPPLTSSHGNMRVSLFYIHLALIRQSLIGFLELWHVVSIRQFSCLWVPVFDKNE